MTLIAQSTLPIVSNQVGQELGLDWEYSEHTLTSLLESIETSDADNRMDVGISCISVTAERERLIDFSHSFTETHTAIAVRETRSSSTTSTG